VTFEVYEEVKINIEVFFVMALHQLEYGVSRFLRNIGTYQTAWFHNSEDDNVNLHGCENLTSSMST
jgi:hypothetical protein